MTTIFADAIHTRVWLDGGPKGAGKRLERGLKDVVGVFAGNLAQVDGHSGIARQTTEELVTKLGIKGAHLLGSNGHVPVELATTGDVDRSHDQGLVERNQGIAKATYAALVAQRLTQRLSQHDARVLHGVVVVHPGVALHMHREVHERVARECREHVVEEPHARRDVRGPGAVEVHRDLD